MEVYNGQPVEFVSIKLDGINAHLDNGRVVSRSNKPLYNVHPSLLKEGSTYEIYLGSFKQTVSVLRTQNHEYQIKLTDIFELTPTLDTRLHLDGVDIDQLFKFVKAKGYEGLVINGKYKVKSILTFDVPIIDIIPGKKRHVGRMGALLTPMGKVGTGFTDKERELEWKKGMLIEVSCMEVTTDNKFRHPRFERIRWDK